MSQKKEGFAVMQVSVPAKLREKFRKKCDKDGVTMTSVIESFLKGQVKGMR